MLFEIQNFLKVELKMEHIDFEIQYQFNSNFLFILGWAEDLFVISKFIFNLEICIESE